jgi:hypothetical protein
MPHGYPLQACQPMRTLLAILDFALVQNFDCAFDRSVLGLVAVEDAVLRHRKCWYSTARPFHQP